MTTWTRWLLMLALLLAATSVQAGTKHYYYTDAQGTVLAKADAQGNIVASYDYTPYGVQVLGTPPSGPAGYTGHVNDAESGFVYMQQRYYDPVVGRFLSVDPVSPESGDLFNSNRYDYTNNNPINHVDLDGRCSDADGSCGRMVAAQGAYANAHPNEPLSPVAKVALGGDVDGLGRGCRGRSCQHGENRHHDRQGVVGFT